MKITSINNNKIISNYTIKVIVEIRVLIINWGIITLFKFLNRTVFYPSLNILLI